MNQSKHLAAAASPRLGFSLELMESRVLLSAITDINTIVAHPTLAVDPAASASQLDGYTPAEIRHAYGFDQISFSNGAVKGSGAGQTIAIVTAYNDPNIASDLHTFDSQFGIADPPSLKKVGQSGGSTGSLSVDGGWSYETALDVEWAHAIAPKANILLVEAASPTLDNLLTAVDFARHASGVSVVSMSWGAGEFWSETSYDSLFSTPSGHHGVSFVAASGDDGSSFGPLWPASSRNVLAVGGTTLSVGNSAGSYSGERAWSGSTGGVSEYESQPSYQSGVQGTGARTSPDVSYNANPSTGFDVYSSISFQGTSGWSVVGGTSAGAPQWSALIAIANQGRALIGKTALWGVSQTLSYLYQAASSASSYSQNFHDVSSGRTGFFVAAETGYDLATGLGSPRAQNVVKALLHSTAASAASVVATASSTSASGSGTAKPAHASAADADDSRSDPTSPSAPRSSTSSTTSTNTGAALVAAAAPQVTQMTRAIVTSAGIEILGSDARQLTGFGAGSVGSAAAGSNGASGRSLGTAAAAFVGRFSPFSQYLISGDDGGALADAAGADVPQAAPAAPTLAAAATIEQALASVPSAERIFHIAHLGSPLAFVADSVAAFAEDAAALPAAALAENNAAVPIVGASHVQRAWYITAAVAAADLGLIAYFYRRETRPKSRNRSRVVRGA